MKNLIITLVAIIVLVVVVLPLIYISLGKIRGPIDSLSSNVTKQTFANQNYIPDSAAPADPNHQADPTGFDTALEARCYASSTVIARQDVVSSYDLKARALNATSTAFRFSWTLPGTWQELPRSPKDGSLIRGTFHVIGGMSSTTELSVSMFAASEFDPECVSYFTRTFSLYHDSGRYLDAGDMPQGLTIAQKGLITIRGIQWYWYDYERDIFTNPGQTPESHKYYMSFNAYRNGISYSVFFTGSQAISKGFRAAQAAAVQYLGGLVLQ